MPTKKQAAKSTKKTKNNSAIKGILVLAGFLLLADLLVFGYLRFSVNFIRCGHPPYAATINGMYGGNDGYTPPGDGAYRITPSSLYFCSAEEAEASGTKVNPLSDEAERQYQERKDQQEKETD